jgi:uncharacterized protein (DUF2062 family)
VPALIFFTSFRLKFLALKKAYAEIRMDAFLETHVHNLMTRWQNTSLTKLHGNVQCPCVFCAIFLGLHTSSSFQSIKIFLHAPLDNLDILSFLFLFFEIFNAFSTV